MNKHEFLAALRTALSVLPEDERASVLRYYEDYFLDAEGESDADLIAGLGTPAAIAADILREYREVQPRPGAGKGSGSHSARGFHGFRDFRGFRSRFERLRDIDPKLLIILAVLAAPLLLSFAATVFGLGFSAAAVVFSVVTALVAVFFALPLSLLAIGAAFTAVSFSMWAAPASAALTLGAGLVSLSLGGLALALVVSICRTVLPPLARGTADLVRGLIEKVRGAFR